MRQREGGSKGSKKRKEEEGRKREKEERKERGRQGERKKRRKCFEGRPQLYEQTFNVFISV